MVDAWDATGANVEDEWASSNHLQHGVGDVTSYYGVTLGSIYEVLEQWLTPHLRMGDLGDGHRGDLNFG